MTPDDLAATWRQRAAGLRRYGAEAQATALEAAAADLEAALAEAADELLSPAEAAEYSGKTERTLRSWRADGRLTNHGSEHRPLYRRGELPRAGGASHEPAISGYDPAADAVRLA